MNTIFRLKFAFYQFNDEGKREKSKMECLAECETYTEAEALAYKIIEKEHMSNLGEMEYEIVKTKFTTKDFIDHNTLISSETTTNGKVECYFSEEGEAFFAVKVKLFSYNEKGKKQSTTTTCIVSDKNINNAVATVRSYMHHGMEDFVITDSKMDAAETIYLLSASYSSIINRYATEA